MKVKKSKKGRKKNGKENGEQGVKMGNWQEITEGRKYKIK